MEQSAPQADEALADAAHVARQYGHHAGRYAFAGVRTDHENGVLTIFRVPTHGFDDEIRALIGDQVQVEIADAAHTRDDLTIAREIAWALQGGFTVETVVIPDDGSRLRVFVQGSEWDAQAEMDRLAPGTADVMANRRERGTAPAFVGAERRGQAQ